MKNIIKAFKINNFTYLLILISFLTGFFKNIILILTIVILHEIGHVLMIHRYEYEIEKIEIFPFGGITKVNKKINTPLQQEIMIALAGVTVQLLLIPIFYYCFKQGWILENTYELFKLYNKTISFFNLLPIIPLDGSIIIHTCLEYFFSYERAYLYYLGLSFFSLIFFVTINTLRSLNNYMILTFLLFKFIDGYQKRKLYQNKFYLERYLYEIPYTKIKSKSYPNIHIMQKDTLHFFWNGKKYLHEKEILKNRYTKDCPNTMDVI